MTNKRPMTAQERRVLTEIEMERRRYKREDHRAGSWEVYIELGGTETDEEFYLATGELPDGAPETERSRMKNAELIAIDS